MELTNGSTVEIVEVPTPGSIDDGWVSVSSQSAPDGVVGWVPERFLAPVLNEPRATDSPLSSWCNGMYGSINAGRVRLYNSPSMAGSILRELQRGLVVRIGEQPVQRPNGVWWVKVSVNAADDVGWIPEQFVSVVLDQPRLWPSPPLSLVGTPASTPVPRPLPPLSRDVETTFTPQALLPYVEDASVQHGADPRLVLAILMKESSLKNWQIGPDGNGFGLIGPDTAHHRPEHERAVGVSIGTDTNPGTVSPEKQIDFLAHVLATYTTTCSGDTAAAVRVWYGGMASSGGEDASAFRGEVDHNVRTLFGP